jgi:hypothetical protein
MVKLEEMAILVVSSAGDKLPFRVAIKSPDHLPAHAHVLDLETGKKDLYQFELTQRAPKISSAIKDYKGEATDEMKSLICKWANKKSNLMPKLTNWELLNLEWSFNKKKD